MRIILLGDLMLGRSFNKFIYPLKSDPLEYPWGNTLKYLQDADLVIGNLETTITNSNKKYPNKVFNYKMDPKYSDTLKVANISYCSLANNHILDYQLEGLFDTMNNLKKLGIKYAGAGLDLKHAMRPAFISKDGLKIGFLSASDHYDYWRAGENRAGIWYINIRDRENKSWIEIFNYVKRVKKHCDILIFSLHWNYNWVDNIEENFKLFGRGLIDSGVDIIHGHSPHHLLPIEKYKNGLIFYSLGDFIDDYAIDSKYRNDLSCIAEIEADKNSIKLSNIYPTKIDNMQVNITQNKKNREIIFKSLNKL